MSKSAVILCLNGRRKTIKFTPNSTIAQILEDVCKKENIDPSAYDLRTTRVILDRTLPWRYTNLPNNAKLELCTRNVENQPSTTTVKIAFQLPDGQRLTGEFSTDTLLSEIVQHFSIQLESLTESDVTCVPTIVYLRQKFVGNNVLCSTTLQKLGIIKGSALLRFMYEPQSSEEDTNKTGVEKAKPSISQESSHSLKRDGVQRTVFESTEKTISHATSSTKSNLPSVSTTLPTVNPVHSNGTASAAFIDIPMHDTESVSERQTKPTALLDYFQSSANNDDESRTGKKVKRKGSKAASAPKKRGKLQGPVTSATNSPPQNFSNFKFPEETKGANLLARFTPPPEEIDLLTPCNRKAMMFNERRKRSDESTSTDEPDEFFEVTVDDLRKMMADLKQERKKLEEQDMLTDDQRKSKRVSLASKYPCLVIRIVLPDRLVLQGLFRPLEKIRSLYEFVEEHLVVKSFYLFTTPPKKMLKDRNSTLFDSNLAPAARVYFGSNENFQSNDQLIKETSANLFCTVEEANRDLASLKT